MITSPVTHQLFRDDDYWAVPVTARDLRDLAYERRHWVARKASVVRHGAKVPAKLAADFVILVDKLSTTTPGLAAVVEGIDGTSLLHVRASPGHKVRLPLAPNTPIELDIFIFREQSDTGSGPWLFSSHSEIGSDPGAIADLLLEAATAPQTFANRLNDSGQYLHSVYEVSPSNPENRTPSTKSAEFHPPTGGASPSVAYQGYQADSSAPGDPVPPACNPVFGVATLDANGDYILTFDLVTIKAY